MLSCFLSEAYQLPAAAAAVASSSASSSSSMLRPPPRLPSASCTMTISRSCSTSCERDEPWREITGRNRIAIRSTRRRRALRDASSCTSVRVWPPWTATLLPVPLSRCRRRSAGQIQGARSTDRAILSVPVGPSIAGPATKAPSLSLGARLRKQKIDEMRAERAPSRWLSDESSSAIRRPQSGRQPLSRVPVLTCCLRHNVRVGPAAQFRGRRSCVMTSAIKSTSRPTRAYTAKIKMISISIRTGLQI